MTNEPCPHCGEALPDTGSKALRYCPHCGKALNAPPAREISELEKRITAEKRPQRKYKLIQEALAKAPDDFEANRALLYHGRLHETIASRKGIDFSAIKCHLMSVFERPSDYTDEVLDAKYDELLRGPQLMKTMALAPDTDAFFAAYIHDMATLYIDLFIRGDSKNSTLAFGFSRMQEGIARKCAEPVRAMLAEIAATGRLTDVERVLFRHAVIDGYGRVFPGYANLLQE